MRCDVYEEDSDATVLGYCEDSKIGLSGMRGRIKLGEDRGRMTWEFEMMLCT